MLVDANILIYAIDPSSPHHDTAEAWLSAALRGSRRVALPWQSLAAFLRIVTHPRINEAPLTTAEAWEIIVTWLELDTTWTPEPGPTYARVLGEVLSRGATGNLVPDAMLAALAIEHGLTVCSADADFARFPDVTWFDPTR